MGKSGSGMPSKGMSLVATVGKSVAEVGGNVSEDIVGILVGRVV